MTTKLRYYIMNRMRKEGYTLQQIGDTFNLTREAIRQKLDKKLPIKSNHPAIKPRGRRVS